MSNYTIWQVKSQIDNLDLLKVRLPDYSDGCPYYGNKEIDYSGEVAERHTNKMVNNMRAKGISVLSYFIGGSYSYEDENKSFKNMYGADASFINATNMMDVAKTMNKKFLEKN